MANPGDFRKIGNSSSRYPYSFDLSADWKGFDIRGFFQGIGKRDWYAGGGNHYFGEFTHSLGQMYKLIIWTTGHRKIPMLIILV